MDNNKVMLLTHNLHAKCVRKFFVNRDMERIISEIEGEITIISGTGMPLSYCHQYVKLRILTLNLIEYKNFIDLAVLEAHLLDCADVTWCSVLGRGRCPASLSHRMYRYSEPLEGK